MSVEEYIAGLAENNLWEEDRGFITLWTVQELADYINVTHADSAEDSMLGSKSGILKQFDGIDFSSGKGLGNIHCALISSPEGELVEIHIKTVEVTAKGYLDGPMLVVDPRKLSYLRV